MQLRACVYSEGISVSPNNIDAYIGQSCRRASKGLAIFKDTQKQCMSCMHTHSRAVATQHLCIHPFTSRVVNKLTSSKVTLFGHNVLSTLGNVKSVCCAWLCLARSMFPGLAEARLKQSPQEIVCAWF